MQSFIIIYLLCTSIDNNGANYKVTLYYECYPWSALASCIPWQTVSYRSQIAIYGELSIFM